jgi:hypothetical protein
MADCQTVAESSTQWLRLSFTHHPEAPRQIPRFVLRLKNGSARDDAVEATAKLEPEGIAFFNLAGCFSTSGFSMRRIQKFRLAADWPAGMLQGIRRGFVSIRQSAIRRSVAVVGIRLCTAHLWLGGIEE